MAERKAQRKAERWGVTTAVHLVVVRAERKDGHWVVQMVQRKVATRDANSVALRAGNWAGPMVDYWDRNLVACSVCRMAVRWAYLMAVQKVVTMVA